MLNSDKQWCFIIGSFPFFQTRESGDGIWIGVLKVQSSSSSLVVRDFLLWNAATLHREIPPIVGMTALFRWSSPKQSLCYR